MLSGSGFSSSGNKNQLVTASCSSSVNAFTLVPNIYQMYSSVYLSNNNNAAQFCTGLSYAGASYSCLQTPHIMRLDLVNS